MWKINGHLHDIRHSIGGRAREVLQALPTPGGDTFGEGSAGILEMLGEYGAALLASSLATTDVEDTLYQLARRYGRQQLRICVLPTLILIEDPAEEPAQTLIFPALPQALRLDQAGRVEMAVRKALVQPKSSKEMLASLSEILAGPPRFGPVLKILGNMLLTVGFGLVLNPTISAIPVYLVLGLMVGIIVTWGSRAATLSLVLPILTAFLVTVLVGIVALPLVHGGVLMLVAPSLVPFLPGLSLTIAAVELTTGQVLSGASRLVYGLAGLGLLSFGVYVGLQVTHFPPAESSGLSQLGQWAPWAGLVPVSLGYVLFMSAPRGSFLWILFATVVSYGAQLLGEYLVGAELSGLVGAIIVIPAVTLAGRLPSAPSPAIMLTCAYWVLVPGAMGFIGLSEVATGTSGAANTMLQTLASIIAIAIGMVLGSGITHDAALAVRAWRGEEASGTGKTAQG